MDHFTSAYYQHENEILTLVEAFKNRTLPAAQWTHQAHLTTGLWFNYNYSELEAICYLRSGIIAYNLSTGGENTPMKGYHETLTIFWSKILRSFILKRPELGLLSVCNIFLNSDESSKDLPLTYYTKEVLFSLEARAMWVKPNLKE
jgi:hypothetical protein